MDKETLETHYRRYIDCLNQHDWPRLGQFVSLDVHHNGRSLGLTGYKVMLQQTLKEIPNLKVRIGMLLIDRSNVAAQLHFECTPIGNFLGVPVNGRRVSFTEHIFYQFGGDKIERAWSIIDKATIEAQLLGT